jgi:hypothetical protein
MTEYLDIGELGELLGRAPETIRKHMRNEPRRVPPKMHIPGYKDAEVEDSRCLYAAGRAGSSEAKGITTAYQFRLLRYSGCPRHSNTKLQPLEL